MGNVYENENVNCCVSFAFKYTYTRGFITTETFEFKTHSKKPKCNAKKRKKNEREQKRSERKFKMTSSG